MSIDDDDGKAYDEAVLLDFNFIYHFFLLTDLHFYDAPVKLWLWSTGVTCVWQPDQISSVLDQS